MARRSDGRGNLFSSGVCIQPQDSGGEGTPRASSGFFRVLFEQAPIGMFCLSLDRRFICINQRFSEMIGYSNEELQDKPLHLISCVDDYSIMSACFQLLHADILTATAMQTCEVRFRCKNGVIIRVCLTVSPLNKGVLTDDMQDECRYYVIFCELVTTRYMDVKQCGLGEQLAYQQLSTVLGEQMDAHFALAVHELKSPLAIIKGNIQLVERYLQRSVQREVAKDGIHEAEIALLQIVDRQVGRINALINNLLDISRIPIGKMQMCFAPCDLVEIVRKAVATYGSAVPDCDIHLDVSHPSIQSPAMVHADMFRIEQVIEHYLANAVRYTGVTRAVDVGLQVLDRQVWVYVHDDGPGIAQEQQEYIWKCFYHDSGTFDADTGAPRLGIGLYISRAIIEYHHGYVGVWSVPGHGATFWFTLPLCDRLLLDDESI